MSVGSPLFTSKALRAAASSVWKVHRPASEAHCAPRALRCACTPVRTPCAAAGEPESAAALTACRTRRRREG
eukprot:5987915-Prymnesium_polylepis.1